MSPRRNQKDRAVELLAHYFSVAFSHSGAQWDRDNGAEMRELVEALCEAAGYDAIETLGKNDYVVGQPLYKVILADSAEQLSLDVTNMMRGGWKPHGSVMTYTTRTRPGGDSTLTFHDLWWAQPMVKL